MVVNDGIMLHAAGDALYALRRSVKDPDNVLQSWDPTLVDPCTWFHVTCDSDNRVTRLLVFSPPPPPAPLRSLSLSLSGFILVFVCSYIECFHL